MSTAREVQLKQIEAMHRMLPQWIATAKAIAAMNAKLAERWAHLVSSQDGTKP